MSKSIMQTEKECYITHSTYNLHVHHIFRGINRENADKYGCWVWLREDWHNGADYGVHGKNGKELDLMLKQECQRRFEALYGRETFVSVFGRNYLDD